MTRGRVVAFVVVGALFAAGVVIVTRSKDDGPPIPADQAAGAAIYERHNCRQCHGNRGVGSADLRSVNRDLASDDALRSWLHHASKTKPGTRMPDYDGIIPEPDFPPLMRFVRWLGAASAQPYDASPGAVRSHD